MNPNIINKDIEFTVEDKEFITREDIILVVEDKFEGKKS